jgi:hypothetical protein
MHFRTIYFSGTFRSIRTYDRFVCSPAFCDLVMSRCNMGKHIVVKRLQIVNTPIRPQAVDIDIL